MSVSRLFGTIAALFLANVPVGYADQFDGLYRPSGKDYEAWSCLERDIGMDGGALAIGGGFLDGVENRCQLTSPRQSTDGHAIRYTAICSAEGSEYQETIIVSETADGIRLTRGNTSVEWTRCSQSPTQTDKIAEARASEGRWTYAQQRATIVSQGKSFSLSCELLNASSTFPTAEMSVPCPLCFPGDITSYTLRIDDGFSQDYEFERVSNAVGSESGLDYYPAWYEGLVQALMAGETLVVLQNGSETARFPLAGSSKAIGALRDDCN